MRILGTKYYGHDSAACIIDTERKTIEAVSTERSTRIKHDLMFCDHLLRASRTSDIDVIAHSFSDFTETDGMLYFFLEEAKRQIYSPTYSADIDKINGDDFMARLRQLPDLINPIALFQQKTEEMAATLPIDFVNHRILTTILPSRFKNAIGGRCPTEIEFYDHHLCHAASAYYPSRFHGEKALVVTLDGWGDGYSSKVYLFDGLSQQCLGGSRILPNARREGRVTSVGCLYNAFTAALGFREGSDEGKVEALAAFGKVVQPIYDELKGATIIYDNAMTFNASVIMNYINIKWLKERINGHAREDVAATIQKYLEDVVVEFINAIKAPDDVQRLAIAGGVAANIIMNLAIFEKTRFKDIHVCPYMGDEGTAVGAAILGAIMRSADIGWLKKQEMPYWGSAFTPAEVLAVLEQKSGLTYRYLGESWTAEAATAIAANKIVSVFASKMEFGPRALGNRSILANPADPTLREKLNVSIKRRPPWQPFCPSILASERERLFVDSFDHKHMAIAFRVRPEHIAQIPSAVHIDGTARPQFVSKQDNKHFYKILTKVKELTGYGVVINTSFNLHGRTIVATPENAISDFLDCNLDALYIEGYEVTRA